MAAAGDFVVEVSGVNKSFGTTAVLADVTLRVRRGEIVSLLGGSGSGKTTLLQIIAGLLRPDRGRVKILGEDMTDRPAQARPVNMMFQSYALFPHLSVADNIAYGLRAVGTPRAEVESLVQWSLSLVRLESLRRRRPDELSGGQRQRVALARCLVKKPAVLLLDEPMAALDKGLREQVQNELVSIQRSVGTSFILVTHDQHEAMAMADRIAVMDRGCIVQVGTPREIYESPGTRFVAEFVGKINILDGRITPGPGNEASFTTNAGLVVRLAGNVAAASGVMASIGVRPELIAVSRTATSLSNDFLGAVERVVYFGDVSRVVVRLNNGLQIVGTQINDQAPGTPPIEAGTVVHVGFASSAARVLGT